MSEKQYINFLRGVPAEEALSALVEAASSGYARVIERYGIDVLQYGHFTGFGPLRELIGNRHGVDPQRVIVGNGGLEMISLFFKSLPQKSTIIVEEASYDRVLLDAVCYGHRLIGVQLTPEGIDVDQFARVVNHQKAAAFYGIPFHQNPTGINYTEANRSAVERICRQHDITCVWDICYELLRYDGESNDAIAVSKWGPVLTSSFTKTIAPGTKCGYIIVPDRYVGHFSRIIANTRINPNLPTQAFVADFMASGRFDAYVDDLRLLYRPRMEALNASLKKLFPGSLAADISGGFFAALTLENVARDQEASFIECAQHAGVGIAPAWDAVSPDCRESKRSQGLFIRLTFPAYAPEAIEWGLTTLKQTAARFS